MTDMTFGEILRTKLEAAGMRAATLAQLAGPGVTKQNITRLLNNTPHPVTGSPPKPRRGTVEKIASVKELNWDLTDALEAAGFAPTSLNGNVNIDIAEGVRVSLLHGKDMSEKDKERFGAAFKVAYETAKQMIEADKNNRPKGVLEI